jgi:hypothetical protein
MHQNDQMVKRNVDNQAGNDDITGYFYRVSTCKGKAKGVSRSYSM